MTHDDDRSRHATDGGGTQPLPADAFGERTAGLPQSVTTTTPMSDLPAAAAQQQPQPPAFEPPRPAPAGGYEAPAGGYEAPAGGYGPPAAGPRRSPRGRRGLILAACALAGIAIGVGAERLVAIGGKGSQTATQPTATASAAPVSADVSSFDPVGTGFPRQTGGVWSSEGYNSATFGNLKPGIGLLLDLGTARPLRSVTLDSRAGTVTVELRAADTRANSVDGYQRVGGTVQAKGPTTLPASSGGSHRYWLVWVTGLAPRADGKFAAQLGAVTARS